MYHASLSIVIADTVQSNCTLVRMLVESEAEALEIPCAIEVRPPLSEMVVPDRGLLFISESMVEVVGSDMLETNEPQTVLVCVYGTSAQAHMQNSDIRFATWPLKRRQMRRLLAEAAVVGGCLPSSQSPLMEDNAFGNPVPVELVSLVPKLKDSIRELWGQSEEALAGGMFAEGARRVHTLKGAAMSFGQLVLAEVAGGLQEAFEAEDAGLVGRWLAVTKKLVAP